MNPMEDDSAETPHANPDATEASACPERATLTLKRQNAETDDVFAIVPPATVGRFDPSVGPIDVDLGMLPEGQYVSRKHARFDLVEGVWVLRDLGSSNGTFVLIPGQDFTRIEADHKLSDGDEIAFGNARFVFRYGIEEEAPGTVEESPVDDTPLAEPE
ncbi:MAG TPA: FHA domain-containing protein [Fimbriimonadaceae bacterium]|nr:FHA domain-containing protein [Fimbriimonadaceae bacterium]